MAEAKSNYFSLNAAADLARQKDRRDVTDLRKSRRLKTRARSPSAFSSRRMTNRMRNTYRPVLLRASVQRDLAGGYRDRRRPLYFYARACLRRSATSRTRLALRIRQRATSECVTSQLTFLALSATLRPRPRPLTVSLFLSLCLRAPGFRREERVTEFKASLGRRLEISLLESNALFVEQGTKRIKAEGKREAGERNSQRCERWRKRGKTKNRRFTLLTRLSLPEPSVPHSVAP